MVSVFKIKGKIPLFQSCLLVLTFDSKYFIVWVSKTKSVFRSIFCIVSEYSVLGHLYLVLFLLLLFFFFLSHICN